MSTSSLKQVIVVRADLKMPPGKLAAQVAHGSVGAFIKSKFGPAWLEQGQAKVVVKVSSLQELLEIERAAKVAKLSSCLIKDEGRTFFHEPTVTVLGLGPAPEQMFLMTKDLKLL